MLTCNLRSMDCLLGSRCRIPYKRSIFASLEHFHKYYFLVRILFSGIPLILRCFWYLFPRTFTLFVIIVSSGSRHFTVLFLLVLELAGYLLKDLRAAFLSTVLNLLAIISVSVSSSSTLVASSWSRSSLLLRSVLACNCMENSFSMLAANVACCSSFTTFLTPWWK